MENDPGVRSARVGLRTMYSFPRRFPPASHRSRMVGSAASAALTMVAKSMCLLIGAVRNVGRRFARLTELGLRVSIKFVAVVERESSCGVKRRTSTYNSLLCQRNGCGWQAPV